MFTCLSIFSQPWGWERSQGKVSQSLRLWLKTLMLPFLSALTPIFFIWVNSTSQHQFCPVSSIDHLGFILSLPYLPSWWKWRQVLSQQKDHSFTDWFHLTSNVIGMKKRRLHVCTHAGSRAQTHMHTHHPPVLLIVNLCCLRSNSIQKSLLPQCEQD